MVIRRLMSAFLFFVFIQMSYGKGKTWYLPCDYYPNKKMNRLYKRNGNICYRIDGFGCVALSETKKGIVMYSYDNNRVVKRKTLVGSHLKEIKHEIIKDELILITWDCYDTMDNDDQVFRYKIKDGENELSFGCIGSWNCIIPKVSDSAIKEIMCLLKDFEEGKL